MAGTKKHHRFKTFNDRIDEVDVNIWRNIEFVRTGEDGAPAGDHEDPEKPHFTELLSHWTQTNRTQDFADCARDLRPLVQSLPMIIFNLEAIVGTLLRHVTRPKSLAAEPVLMLLGALGRDVRGELTPYFGKIFSTLVGLLGVATRVGEQNAELVELIFQSLAYILKYLARYVAQDLPSYLTTYTVLLSHQKSYIRHFAGETLAFIIRRLRAGRMEAAVCDIFSLLSADRTLEELTALSDSLSVMLFEATKSIQRKFHSQMQSLVEPLLSLQVRADADALESPARAAKLWTVKAALLRMRNHADGLEGSADLLEVIFTHFRDAVQHYCASVNGKSSQVEQIKSVDEGDLAAAIDTANGQNSSDLAASEQEMLFYIDLLVSWVWVKPKPRTADESDWAVFVDVTLGGLRAVLVATRKCEATSPSLELANGALGGSSGRLQFPPMPLPVGEAAARALVLLWRALPVLVRARCDGEMARLLAERPEAAVVPQIQAALPFNEKVLSLLAVALLPDPLPGLERTPLMRPLLATVVETIAPGAVEDVDLGLAATSLCSAILQHAGRQCLAESVGILANGTSQNALLVNLLSSSEAALAGSSLEKEHLARIAAATGCVLQLCRTCHSFSPSTGSFMSGAIVQRCALLVARIGSMSQQPPSNHIALIRSRLLSCTAFALLLGDCWRSCPPAESWPEGVSPLSNDGLATWIAWFLAWASSPPLQAPVMHAVHESLQLIAQHHKAEHLSTASFLKGVAVGCTMVQCRHAAVSSDRWIRHGAVHLSSVFPEQLLLRPLRKLQLSVTAGEAQTSLPDEEADWHCAEEESADAAQSEHLEKLFELCKQLEDLDVDWQSERVRAGLMYKISRVVRRLPLGCWASALGVQLLIGQLSVKLATAWEPALEALLHVASDAAVQDEGGSTKKRGKARGKKKKRKPDDVDAPQLEDASTPAPGEEIHAVANAVPEDASTPAPGEEIHAVAHAVPEERSPEADAKVDQDMHSPNGKGAEVQSDGVAAVAVSKGGKKRRRVSLTSSAQDSKGPEDLWLLEEGAGSAGLEELSLEPWLAPYAAQGTEQMASPAWWWMEAIWNSGVGLVLKYEAPVVFGEARDTDDAMEIVEDDAEADEQKDENPKRKASSPKMPKYTKLKRKQTHQMLSVEGPLNAAEGVLWQSGVKGWRSALGMVWQELSQWESMSTYGITMHELAWKLLTRLLEQNYWHVRSSSLTVAQDSLGRHHTEWMLAKFLQLLCGRYGQGRAGRMGSKPSLMHALQCIAKIPSIEVCARPLVQLCAHGCLHWLLLQQDTKLQHLALTVMSRCKRLFPQVAECEESLKRLCDDATFHHELLSLSVSAGGEAAAVRNEGEGLGFALYRHRDALMPIVLRILFSKATKRGQALDKHSSQQSRRSSVFSYLSALTEQAGMPELLLVLLEPLLVVLTTASDEGIQLDPCDAGAVSRLTMISSSIRRTSILRQIFSDCATETDGSKNASSTWFTSPLNSIGCLQSTSATGVESLPQDAPSGWTWQVSGASTCSSHSQMLAMLNPTAKNPQWLGLLHTMGDLIPQMASKVAPHAVFLMEILASLIERLGSNARDQARAEQAPIIRQILRLAVLRAKDLFEKYTELVEKLVVAFRPAAATLEFLFGRLASTSGSVQVSAVVLLAQSWVKDPALFYCFQELCPHALPSLFRVPAGPSVRAMVATGDRQVGAVVPIVIEIALRLSRGGVLDLKGMKKARRNYLDIKRERRQRKKIDGDESGDSVSGDGDSDDDGQLAWGLSKAEQEENTKLGVALLRPHVDVLLSSMHELIQHRLQFRSQAKPGVGASHQPSGRGRRGDQSSRRLPPVATANEMSLMASVAEWCTDENVAQKLVGLLVTALSDLARDRKAHSDQLLFMVAALRRLVFIALPASSAQTPAAVLTKVDAPAGDATPDAMDTSAETKETSMPGSRPSAAGRAQAERSQADNVANSLVRLLGIARDVALRAQLGELLVEVESLRAFKDQARAYCDRVADIDVKDRWQPNANKPLADMLAQRTTAADSASSAKDSPLCAIHVAHVVAALNTLRRSGLREPDVDMHVEVLQVLGDCYLLPPDARGQDTLMVASTPSINANEPMHIFPAALLQPIISHTLFVISVGEGVDIGVQHGMERLLCTLADRLVLAVNTSRDTQTGGETDASELLHLILVSVVPGLRKMLRAPHEEVYRTSLRILGHFARHLAPHSAVLQAWSAAARRGTLPTEVGDAASAFGSSPGALLHADLQPLLRSRDLKGDEGGDLFGNLLHLQKHRRGRGLAALNTAAAEGSLTSNTLSHFVLPICLQAILQRGSSTAAFDANYAEVAVKCLGECMRHVAWSSCLQTVRYLSTLLAKQEREKWVIRAACECLGCFPFPANPLPSPESFTGWSAQQEDGQQSVEVETFEALPESKPEKGRAKGKGKGKGRKGKGKGKNKGRNKGKHEDKSEDGGDKDNHQDKGEDPGKEMPDKDMEAAQANEAVDTELDAVEAAPGEPNRDVAAAGSKAESMARSLRTTVLPILKKMVWQKDRGSAASAPDDRAGSKGGGKGSRTNASGGLVRIPVIGVMMHCVKHLTESGFKAELPRIVSLVIAGLSDRDVDHRRAARQAAQKVIASLGPAWLGWLLGEMRIRLNRGFMVPVCAATSLSCVQVLSEECTLSPGDLDAAFQEIMQQIELELLRVLDPVKNDADLEEGENRPGLAPEAKKPKGPELLLLASQFASPKLVLDALWALDRRLQGELPEQAAAKKGPALAPLPSQSLTHLRRVEELLMKAMAGLSLNSEFSVQLQVSFVQELLSTVASLLKVGRFGTTGTASAEATTKDQPDDGTMAVAKSREKAFAVQPGAASGRSVSAATPNRSKGIDAHARAGVLGVLGLRMLQNALKKRALPTPLVDAGETPTDAASGPKVEGSAPEVHDTSDNSIALKLEVEIVPAVVTCFCSRQDRLFVASAKCLNLLRGFYASRPQVVGAHGARIAKTVLKTFEIVAGAPQLSQHLRSKAKSRGLADVGAAAVLATSTQLLSALLGNQQSVEWFKPLGAEKVEVSELGPVPQQEDSKGGATVVQARKKGNKSAADALVQINFFDALVTHIRTALDQPALQPSALQLLRRVLLRNRLLTAAVYQCIDAVGELLITAQEKRLAQQCAQIYVDFMLDYPHAERALQQRLMHLLKNLGYVEEAGRRAVLNCLYLVVLHFPEAELTSKWSGMIFVSVAARLPQEADPTAHQMLHVVIKSLLEHVSTAQHTKLLEVALSWQRSPKRVLHAALAECLGLFAEAVGPRSAQWMNVVLPALAGVIKSADSLDTSMTALAEQTAGPPPWRAVYAVSRAFEKILASSTAETLDQLLVENTKPAREMRSEQKAAGAEVSPTVLLPGAALAYLWQRLFGGKEVFTSEELHPWVLAVALRALEGQLARCMPEFAQQSKQQPSKQEQVAERASLWLGGYAPQHARIDATTTVTASNLLRALEALFAAERLERDPTVAPLGLRALCALTNLLLRAPDLMPNASAEEEAPLAGEEQEEEDDDEEAADDGDARLTVEAAVVEADSSSALTGSESRPPSTSPVQQVESAVQGDETSAREEDQMEPKDESSAKTLSADPEKEDEEVAVDELEGSRQMGPSLFETVTGSTDSQLVGQDALPASKLAAPLNEDAGTAAAVLQKSRVRWLVVRLSHRARTFLSQPSSHFVRLISTLRYFTALTETLPPWLLLHLLEPILTPVYRCISAFAAGANSTLPDVQTLEQAVQLATSQRLEFLAQLAQACMDSLTSKMQESGHGSQLMQALAKVRRAVERQRAERSQKKRLQRITDPQAAAQQKRAKNRRKQVGKKRKLEEVILATKGGRGVVGSSKKQRTLA